ncbi:hypothetical protein MRX96_058608 [Rhipicephalus microplus]
MRPALSRNTLRPQPYHRDSKAPGSDAIAAGGKRSKKASRAEEIAGKLLIRQAGDVGLARRPGLTPAAMANRWTQVASWGRWILYVWCRFSSPHKLRGEPEGGATGNDRWLGYTEHSPEESGAGCLKMS